MFLGRFEHAMDSKGRLTIPARFREELEGGLVISFAPRSVLRVYPQDVWNEISTKLARMPQNDRVVTRYTRFVYGSACEATLDKMGRILIPAFMRDYAHIERETQIVGANTVFDIWALDHFREFDTQNQADIEEIWHEMAAMQAQL